jgi:hypothetical protein
LIEQFIEKELPMDEIIDSLVCSAHVEWEMQLEDNMEREGWKTSSDILIRYREFQREVRAILTKRNIPNNVIEQILKHLELVRENNEEDL